MNDNCDVSMKKIKEAICIDAARVYDSCADKDCLADLRVYFTDIAQEVVDRATSIRCRGAEVINVISNVERVPFNKGFYSVDITYFFCIKFDAVTSSNCPPEAIKGIAVFSKKCILYGSDGNVKIFSSELSNNENDEQSHITSSNPRAKIQVAEPLCLDAKLCRPCDCCNNIVDISCGIPKCVKNYFTGQFCHIDAEKAVRVTIGLFTIIQLERDVQMLIPSYDFCVPSKECSCDTEDPCDSFRKIKFPVSEFFPPSDKDCDKENIYNFNANNCGCGR